MKVQTPPSRPAARRSGQTLIFMVLAMVLLTLVALWNFDLHKILYVKHISRNAGDAAALAAARWQGITLNLIGELNVLQAVAITEALSRGETNFVAARALADLEARLNLVGPITGLAAAQQAAKNNGVYVNASFSEQLASHAQEVRQSYNQRYPVPPYANEPSPPTAWDDYADMLEAIAAQGVAAYPENAKLHRDYENRNHFLLNPDFYDAVFTSDWCWFFHHAMDLLSSYRGYRDWPPLPLVVEPEPINSEFFGLHLRRVQQLEELPALDPGAGGDAEALLARLSVLAQTGLAGELASVAAAWYAYRDGAWASWAESLPGNFPFLGDIKSEYDYRGADAAVLIQTMSDTLMPGATNRVIAWTAAAKPFGSLDGSVPPNRYSLVLPAFREVRLIPLDASSAPASGSRPGWGLHIYDHLAGYTARGLPALVPGCWYCRQLRRWEDSIFRQDGLDWLALNSSQCRIVLGGSGGPGGGTRRGH